MKLSPHTIRIAIKWPWSKKDSPQQINVPDPISPFRPRGRHKTWDPAVKDTLQQAAKDFIEAHHLPVHLKINPEVALVTLISKKPIDVNPVVKWINNAFHDAGLYVEGPNPRSKRNKPHVTDYLPHTCQVVNEFKHDGQYHYLIGVPHYRGEDDEDE
jgi:hypothetical protein